MSHPRLKPPNPSLFESETVGISRSQRLPESRIIVGDSLAVLKTLPSNSCGCCVSSPPYFGLRDYGVDRQIGAESSLDDYVTNLCDIFEEVRRVLRQDGTL